MTASDPFPTGTLQDRLGAATPRFMHGCRIILANPHLVRSPIIRAAGMARAAGCSMECPLSMTDLPPRFSDPGRPRPVARRAGNRTGADEAGHAKRRSQVDSAHGPATDRHDFGRQSESISGAVRRWARSTPAGWSSSRAREDLRSVVARSLFSAHRGLSHRRRPLLRGETLEQALSRLHRGTCRSSAGELIEHIRANGPVRSADFEREAPSNGGWWSAAQARKADSRRPLCRWSRHDRSPGKLSAGLWAARDSSAGVGRPLCRFAG